MSGTNASLSRRDLDCIESIHALSSGGWSARVKDVASRMKVTPPTAVGFLDKLMGMVLVEKGPSGYRLTAKGAECFDEATRAHRLLETLLARNGIPLEEACRISSILGSPIAEADLEKLCSHLRHPEKCPHGRPIPAGARHG